MARSQFQDRSSILRMYSNIKYLGTQFPRNISLSSNAIQSSCSTLFTYLLEISFKTNNAFTGLPLI